MVIGHTGHNKSLLKNWRTVKN